jgi:hypothetical protein
MGVPIKIRHARQPQAHWESWAVRAASVNIVVKIPYRCLMGAEVAKHIVWVAIAVKVSYCSPSYASRRGSWCRCRI